MNVELGNVPRRRAAECPAHGQLELDLRAGLVAVGLCLPVSVQHRSSCGGWRDGRCGWLKVPDSVSKYFL